LSTLTHAQARRAYDRIGSLQDTQAFYEDAATGRLLREGSFSSADSVFEFGCGTGRFARRLFDEQLSPTARYRGVDLSPEMVRLATRRLEPYAPRAEVALSEGGPPVDEPSDHYDRFVSNYVFDLLSDEDMRSVVREAHRMLRRDGLLCVSSLSSGVGPASRAVARVFSWVQAHRPSLVGGCRPVELLPLLEHPLWEVEHHAKVVSFAVPSEVIVARRC
jgi:SAM-dependent methyltransferase